MKATTTRRGGVGALPAAKRKKKKKAPPRGFMCGCGGAKSVSISTVSRAAVSISAVTTTTPVMKAASTAAKPAAYAETKMAPGCRDADEADASAEVTPSVDSLLRQLRELERGVRALGVRERDGSGGGGGGSAPRATRPRRPEQSAGGGSIGRLDSESVAVETETEDPLGEFRRSMVQMIVEKGITGGAELRELLHRFLSLNAACHHHLILRAFADVWEELFAGAGVHGHAPSYAPAPAEDKISCGSSRGGKRPHALSR
ncbi:unnamed protein product [Urochloa humidicola]